MSKENKTDSSEPPQMTERGKHKAIEDLLAQIRNDRPNVDVDLSDGLVLIIFSFKFDEAEERSCYPKPERSGLTVEELKETFRDEIEHSLHAIFGKTDFERDWKWSGDTFIVTYNHDFETDKVVPDLERVAEAMKTKGNRVRWG